MRWGLPAAVLVFSYLSASADVVVMKNGDRVTGKVTSLADGKLKIETAYMGKVAVDFDEVSSLVTDEPVAVGTRGGSRLVGALSWKEGGRAAISRAETVLAVAAASVTAIGPVEEPAGGKWTGSFEAGVSGQSGNSETIRGAAKVAVKREAGDVTLEGYASGRYAREDGQRSANQQRAGGRMESKWGRKGYWYTAVEFLRDEFKDLDLRTTASIGAGRMWWKEDENFWKTSAGVGFTHEVYSSGDGETFPVAEIAGEYGRKINGKCRFANTTKFFMDLAELAGWRAENDAALYVDLTENGNWQLKLGVNHEYDNRPSGDVERLDTYYYLNAVRKF